MIGPAASLARALLALSACAVFAAPAAFAQEDKKAAREREQLRRAQAALKQAEEARAALAREKSELEAKAGAAQQRADALEKAERGLRGAVAQAKRAETQLAADLAREREAAAAQKARLEETERRLGEANAAAAEGRRGVAARDAQLKLLTDTLAQARTAAASEIGACEARNAKLYAHAVELMRLYRDKTALDAIRQAEPFTALGAVGVEAVLEEYRDKLAAERAGGAAR
jgi:chromosome segregation ATPase